MIKAKFGKQQMSRQARALLISSIKSLNPAYQVPLDVSDSIPISSDKPIIQVQNMDSKPLPTMDYIKSQISSSEREMNLSRDKQ